MKQYDYLIVGAGLYGCIKEHAHSKIGTKLRYT